MLKRVLRQQGAAERINWADTSRCRSHGWTGGQADSRLLQNGPVTAEIAGEKRKVVPRAYRCFLWVRSALWIPYLDPSEVAYLRDALHSTRLNECVIERHSLVNKPTSTRLVCMLKRRKGGARHLLQQWLVDVYDVLWFRKESSLPPSFHTPPEISVHFMDFQRT